MTETADDKQAAGLGNTVAGNAKRVSLSAWLDREIGIIFFDSKCRKYYHAPFMSEAVHSITDPFGFARAASQCSGQMMIAAMPRLQDRLAGNEGTVTYMVQGGQDQLQRPLLDLKIDGILHLQCGRCLAALDHALALRPRLLLSSPGQVHLSDDDPEAPDWIEVEVEQELDLLALIEDEILLGLPLAVRHEPDNFRNGKSASDLGMKAEAPFARLATLLKPKRVDK